MIYNHRFNTVSTCESHHKSHRSRKKLNIDLGINHLASNFAIHKIATVLCCFCCISIFQFYFNQNKTEAPIVDSKQKLRLHLNLYKIYIIYPISLIYQFYSHKMPQLN